MPLRSVFLRLVLLVCAAPLCLSSFAQGVWNPDYNGDGLVTSADLTGFLTAWEQSVDSVVRSPWEVHCDALMEGEVPLDSVEFTLSAMDIQLRENDNGVLVLDTAWVDQTWMVTNIPVEFNHVRFFGPTPFVTGQVSYHPDSDSYIWYMEFNESLFFTPDNNHLAELQADGWFDNIYVFEDLMPFAESLLLPHSSSWHLAPRFNGGDYGLETWTVLDFSVTFHGAL